MKDRLSIICGIIALGIVTCINPVFPDERILQHIGTAFLLLPLIIDLKRNYLSRSSFIGISLFTVIHIIGARYIYSYVPYNEWSNSYLGLSINDYFGFKRNHYDRFVHFAFGGLIFAVINQMIIRFPQLPKIVRIIFVLAVIQSFSMLYELFEWSLTIFMGAEIADNYNGQQGDMWDAQKDMAFAMLGSFIMAFVCFIKKENPNLN